MHLFVCSANEEDKTIFFFFFLPASDMFRLSEMCSERSPYIPFLWSYWVFYVVLFLCGLFNDAVNMADYIESNDTMIQGLINNELEVIRKEVIVA
jgi:hypothetical protein